MSRHTQGFHLFRHQAVTTQVGSSFCFQSMARKPQNQRFWQKSSITKNVKIPQHGFFFTLMSYNVLSQVILEMNTYLYQKCNPQYLNWQFREGMLLKELTEHSADVICLQEVDQVVYLDVFEPYLQRLGYTGLYKKKPGEKTDGCAIFFKDTVFSLVNHVGVEFQDEEKIPLLSRPNVGIIALLRPKRDTQGSKNICIATTHLFFNPKRGDIKLAQLVILLAEIEKMAFHKRDEHNVPNYWPVLLCGDMNSVPFSPLYEFVTKGQICYDGMKLIDISRQLQPNHDFGGKVLSNNSIDLTLLGISRDTRYINGNPRYLNKEETMNQDEKSTEEDNASFRHGFKFKSAYRHFGQCGSQEISTFNNNTRLNVDYIFYTTKQKDANGPIKQKQLLKLYHLGSYRLLNEKEINDRNIQGLPNEEWPSDHFSLISQFCLAV